MPLSVPRRAGFGSAALLSFALWGPISSAHAAVSLLQPPRAIDGTRPFTLTLLVSADQSMHRYAVPDTLQVTAVADLAAPVRIDMKRTSSGPAILNLREGDIRTITYSAEWPAGMRGQVRLDVAGIDAAPVIISLNRAPAPGEVPAVPAAPVIAGSQPATNATADHRDIAATPVTPIVSPANGGTAAPAQTDLHEPRLSFNDPMYFMVGARGGANAKFQISFKYRIFEGENPASKNVLDNLYFAYTQFSLWDLHEESAPFRDTNYRPSLYYYLSDTGVRNRVISRLALATGFEHESNGRSGAESRSINMLFVKPTMYFGDETDWHWRVAPKIYAYVDKSDNEDIPHYRGYTDLLVAYGKPDSWEFSATLRKGTRKGYGSVNAQLTYPLERLLPGTAGYLMAGYFYGYGESLLDYNHKSPWQFRIGYALSR